MKRAGCLAAILLAAAPAACGKKGAPLPPALRVPAPVGEMSAVRIGDEVYVRFTVPLANVDGGKPADVGRVEVYAITAEREPTPLDDPEDLRQRSTLIATHPVRRPLPPPPPAKPGEPAPPPPPLAPGLDQGAAVVAREQLTPALRMPVALPDRQRRRVAEDIAPPVGPLIAPLDGNEPKRYYYAVAVSPGGRYGPAQPFVPVPLESTSAAPGAPALSYDEKTLTIKWTPPADARGSQSPSYPDVIPSKPLLPEVPPTTYDVYEVAKTAEEPAALDVPKALTPAPVGELQITQPITTLGVERCFVVRAVDILAGYHVRGPASPVACLELKDTFAPAAPASLAAVASAGAINLIWDPSAAPDLAGYLLLRADVPGATLTPLTKEPIDKTAFVDTAVRAGVTYTYAVVAVDKAGNRSAESNRVEETARQ